MPSCLLVGLLQRCFKKVGIILLCLHVHFHNQISLQGGRSPCSIFHIKLDFAHCYAYLDIGRSTWGISESNFFTGWLEALFHFSCKTGLGPFLCLPVFFKFDVIHNEKNCCWHMLDDVTRFEDGTKITKKTVVNF